MAVLFSFRHFFRHSACAPSWRLNFFMDYLSHVIHIFLEFGVLSSSLRCTAASLGKEKLFHFTVAPGHRAAAWPVYTFDEASSLMTHQPIVGGGENEDFFGFRRVPL